MRSRNQSPLSLETLEDRYCPTLNFFFDGLGNLTVTGTPNGMLTVASPSSGMFSFTDNTSTRGPFAAPGNLSLQFGTSAADDTIMIDLMGNSIGGNLTINTGTGFDTVILASLAPAVSTISGNVNLNGVNSLTTVDLTVGGNLFASHSFEHPATPNGYALGGTALGGSFNYLGGNNVDIVSFSAGILSPTTFVGGNTTLSLGNGASLVGQDPFMSFGNNLSVTAGSGDDNVSLNGFTGGSVYFNAGGGNNVLSFSGSIGGNVTWIAGSGDDVSAFTGSVAGNAFFSLGGGNNGVTFDGSVFGRQFSYFGGSGEDNLTFNGSAPLAQLIGQFAAGNDEFTLGASADQSRIIVDLRPLDDTITK
ncbi:MAG: hypothetical protein ACFCD0_03670, partial [Gemmataceae bacterium]